MIHLLGQTILTSLYIHNYDLCLNLYYNYLVYCWLIGTCTTLEYLLIFAHMHSYQSSSLPYLIVPVLNQYITRGNKAFPISLSWFVSPIPYRTGVEPVYHKREQSFSHQFELHGSSLPYLINHTSIEPGIEPVYHRGNKAGGEDYRSLLIINIIMSCI